ncbi:MAG: hypothetical protein JWO82_3254 [Akkermansiaceae bacterium]|nr:hypothetical protein [Akkermansiaceae bacterium]
MRAFIIAIGVVTALLGIIGFSMTKDPMMLQGGLTLGGGWIICALFSFGEGSKWHGVVGAGILGLLGAARCVPSIFQVPGSGKDPIVLFQAIAAVLCLVTVVTIARMLYAERARRQIAALKAGD